MLLLNLQPCTHVNLPHLHARRRKRIPTAFKTMKIHMVASDRPVVAWAADSCCTRDNSKLCVFCTRQMYDKLNGLVG
jgi:hypothetical protein